MLWRKIHLNFKKNDSGFMCQNCGHKVEPLKYSSRDHCTQCLYSLHVDIMPGDRQNDCKGLLEPIGVEIDGKKGYVILYKCQKCGQLHRNKSAQDDNFDSILKIMDQSSKKQF